jgi:carbonic anhydrase
VNITEGYKYFQNVKFKNYEDEFIKLVKDGQSPKTMFIGCSDSRVIPSLIMNTRPGDLFVVRNIGNFVPPFKPDQDFHGTAAAIEYAVSVLKVENIIVCGHSHCGAIKAMYERDSMTTESLIHTKKWLELGLPAKEIVEKSSFTSSSDKLEMTEKASITFQLKNLLTYPEVKKSVESKELFLHGWYYHLESGEVEYYNSNKNSFLKISD